MSKRNKKLLIYLLILFLPFSFLFLKQTIFQPFKMQVVDLVSLPARIVLLPFQEIKKILFYHSTFNKYIKLNEEVGKLQAKVIEQNEILEENKRLKALLELKWNSKYPMVAAKVVGRDPSNWNATIIIDKGEKEGIKQGMSAVTYSSVIGRILEVGKTTSKVMLLSDPSFSVAALLERSREGGLISGTLQGTCRMRYLSPQADIRVGDKVITSNLSSSFPEGLLIGEVVRIVEDPNNPTLECLVSPSASLSQIEEILIIKNN